VTLVLAFAAVLVLLVLTAFFATVETILLRLNIARAMRMDQDAEQEDGALVWLLEHRGRSLNAVLMNAVGVRVGLAVVGMVALGEVLPRGVSEVVGVVVVAVLSMVLGEVAPRTMTARSLERAAHLFARPAKLMVQLTSPVANVLVTLGRSVAGTRTEVSGPYPNDEEMRRLLDVADEEAVDRIEDEERQMIRSIFELGDTLVREIMVPRPDMVMVATDAPLRELVNSVIKNGRSRIPVHGATRDDIVGIVYAKDVLRHLAMQPGVEKWSTLVRPPTFVPEAKRVDELLRDLQEQTVHLALVVDEYGAVVGLVTIEDILEEIVGEIVDEHDREEPLVVEIALDTWRVDARLPVDELSELVSTALPQDGWDSVGGLVFGVLGRVPDTGEAIEIEGLRLTAERVQGRRISRVLVSRLLPASDEAASA
jgi:CBS domain containing-hemolysin-like protein